MACSHLGALQDRWTGWPHARRKSQASQGESSGKPRGAGRGAQAVALFLGLTLAAWPWLERLSRVDLRLLWTSLRARDGMEEAAQDWTCSRI